MAMRYNSVRKDVGSALSRDIRRDNRQGFVGSNSRSAAAAQMCGGSEPLDTKVCKLWGRVQVTGGVPKLELEHLN